MGSFVWITVWAVMSRGLLGPREKWYRDSLLLIYCCVFVMLDRIFVQLIQLAIWKIYILCLSQLRIWASEDYYGIILSDAAKCEEGSIVNTCSSGVTRPAGGTHHVM